MKRPIKLSWALLLILAVTLVSSCKKDKSEPEVIASFSSKVDAADFMKIVFTNESKNFESVSWDFGDGSALSTEENPTHTYATLGEFTVKLTAKSPGGVSDVYPAKVTISDPNAELTKLVGEGTAGKTWKLIRDVSKGTYPIACGPIDHSTIWWAMGKDNDEVGNRPCMLNDEFTFKRDGTLIYDAKGDYWAEGDVFKAGSNNICASTTDPMVGKDPENENLSAWGGGTHKFRLNSAAKKITAVGKGAFIGFLKAATDIEVMKLTPMIQDSVTYDIISLYEGTTDTLIVQVNYKFAVADASPGGFWRFVLVHYDNPADEPPIPGNKPAVGFSYALTGLAVTFTNTTTGGVSYAWDFGDGQTSTAMSPVHTYAADGIYDVKLTATNAFGSNSLTKTIATSVLTEANLVGGAWKLKNAENSIYCGPSMGSNGWWVCPKSYLDGADADPINNWSCMMDDEFVFSTGGGYQFKTNGGTRNDGYMGTPNGCWTDTQIAASPGAPFGSCATHTFTFTPATATSRAIITLTNGPGYAAFLGFMKGYYGGENLNGANPANGGFATNKYEVMAYGHNGGKEVMIVTCDISGAHDGSASWTTTLER